MNRATLGALLAALLSTTLSACSDDGDDPAAPTETVTVTASPDAAPLELTSDTVRDTACLGDPALPDLAWFAAQWRADVDLEELAFELVGGRGVEQVGAAETVPPVNYGGAIAFDGTATWAGRRELLASVRTLRGEDVQPADEISPAAGQTGLVVLRLRFDREVLGSAEGGRIEGVRATYTTLDGVEGEVEVDTPTRLFTRQQRC